MEIRDTTGVSDPAYLAALEEAVEQDPAFVRAWAEMAGVLSLGNFSKQDPDSIQRIEEILIRIQQHAPQSADLLIAQGYYSYYILKDYKEAHQLIKLAQNLRPSDERVIELKAHIERRMGEYATRIDSIRLAKSLDPRNPHWTKLLIRNLVFSHQYALAETEIERSIIQDIELSELQLSLNLQNNWDPDSWVESLDKLQKEYGVSAHTDFLWDARIAARQFTEAENLLKNVQDQYQHQDFQDLTIHFNFPVSQIITFWFLGDSDQLVPLLDRTRHQLEQQRNSEGDFRYPDQYLIMAFISAAEGDTEEASRLTRSWLRAVAPDLANLNGTRHFACRVLGLAAASSEAVECIHTGLSEPSYIMPFIEPNLPYYDAIRDTPEFTALLAQIQKRPD
jgi:tetratricopeptide (TPR) repeat protein